MDFFTAIILGVVEGITEFLPISSTGHLILTAELLKIPQSEFLKSFEIAIQLGAILAVVVLYWRLLIIDREMLKKVAFAFVPTAFIGLIFYKIIKSFLLGNQYVVLYSLLIGGIFIIIFERVYQRKYQRSPTTVDISYRHAFLIGLFQSLAMVPGVSRAAATIIGGLMLGINRKAIVEFSFLLAVPTMFSATALDLVKTRGLFTHGDVIYIIVGLIVSFVTAIAAIKFLLNFIKNNSFIPFGIYRVILALLFILFLR